MPEQYVNGILYDTVTGERLAYPTLTKDKADQPMAGTGQSVATVALATSPGTPGEIRFNTTHAFFCIAKNTWRRVAIATW